jgi:hypothetical protein
VERRQISKENTQETMQDIGTEAGLKGTAEKTN